MAKPNYQYEKRQRELAKKAKKAEKEAEKAARKAGGRPEDESPEDPGNGSDAASSSPPGPDTAGDRA